MIVEGRGSTVVDADGTEYLDAMAGLWCVNIGYGRTELADVAAEQMRALPYYPHTAINAPPPRWPSRSTGCSGATTTCISSLGLGGQRGRRSSSRGSTCATSTRARPATRRSRRYFGYHGTTLATLAAGGMGDRKMKFEPLSGNEFVHVARPTAIAARWASSYPTLRLGVRKKMEATIQGEGPDTVADGPHRADHERGRHSGSARRVPARRRRDREEVRHACSTWTRSSTASAAPARCSRTSTTASGRTWSASPRACRARTCRSPPRW